MPTLEKLFRIAHNIKGSSKAVGFDALGAFTHKFESFMLQCKSGQIPITAATVSLLLKCNDHIKFFIDQLKENTAAVVDSEQLVTEIQNFNANPPTETVEATVDESNPPAEETISLDEVKLLTQANEVAPAIVEPTPEPAATPAPQAQAPAPAPAPAQATDPAPQVTAPVAASSSGKTTNSNTAATADESIRVSLARLEKLLNFVGELVIYQTVLREQVNLENLNLMRKTVHQMGKVTKEVQDISMSLRMVPLKQTFQKMQRIVRDTSSILGKKVTLTLQGEDTEVDKTVLEALGDPLVHLIRNAVDHGIEAPEERLKNGKPESGTVTLRAYHESGKLVIEVKDNGGGIPADKLRKKAVEKGILKPNQTISDQEAVNLIFHPGFSTKAQVTEVSGRGVGMDVVKTNIENIQGEVLVDTKLGEGSTFKIILPLTLAIIDGMVVRSGQERYVIPLAHVHESLKPGAGDIHFATGVGEVLLLRGENLPVVRLSNALGKKKNPKTDTVEQIAIIVRTQHAPFATLVDDVVGQHQVVIKKLGNEIQNLKGYSGSAILGDGKPALILELADLISSNPSLQKRQAA